MSTRKLKVIVLVSLVIILAGMPAVALKFTGYIRNYMAPFLDVDAEYTLVKDTFNLDIEHTMEKVGFKTDLFINHYPNEDLEMGLRQAYMDIFLGSLDIRVGKQQIIWGKAEGVFITDIVSPRDLQQFILPDFTEIRMGVTAVKATYAVAANKSLEVVWIPIFTPTGMPDSTSVWFPPQTYPTNTTFDYSKKEVNSDLANSEVFAKFSMISSKIDLELMVGYAWDDDPAIHTINNVSNIIIIPEHHRLGIAGGSFSSTIGKFIFRGELAYYMGKHFSANILTTDGTIEKDYLHYLGGIDFSIGNVKLSVQFIQQAIFNYDSQINNDEFENTLTFRASTDFLRQTLKMEVFSYIGLNDQDALVRFKVSYDISDGFTLTLGTDLFFGDEGMFGQFDKNDLVYSQLKFSF